MPGLLQILEILIYILRQNDKITKKLPLFLQAGAGKVRMDPCERILAEMEPVIRAFHRGTWMTRKRDMPPKIAEDLWREMRKRRGAQESTSDMR